VVATPSGILGLADPPGKGFLRCSDYRRWPVDLIENGDGAEKHLTDILRESQKTVVDKLILSAAVRSHPVIVIYRQRGTAASAKAANVSRRMLKSTSRRGVQRPTFIPVAEVTRLWDCV